MGLLIGMVVGVALVGKRRRGQATFLGRSGAGVHEVGGAKPDRGHEKDRGLTHRRQPE